MTWTKYDVRCRSTGVGVGGGEGLVVLDFRTTIIHRSIIEVYS
jgi:hypothetical protein